jgi:hypothetical protein
MVKNSPGSSKQDELFYSTITESYTGNPRFLRRDWLATEVDSGLRDPECRFLLLTAEPGAGKSTFIAQLSHDHPQWPVYYIRRNQRTPLGGVGAHSFLLQIGYQLAAMKPELFARERVKLVVQQRIGVVDTSGEIVAAEIQKIFASPFYQNVVQIQQQVERGGGHVVGLRVGEWIVDPRLLPVSELQYMALIDPALALLDSLPEERIVILVDALDELRYHYGEQTLLDWLTNCPQLPRNVRFVLTTRPPDVSLLAFCEKQKPFLRGLSIGAEDKRVQAELQTYIDRVTDRPEVAFILENTEGGRRGFTTNAIAKAEGNIGYLDALARGIDRCLAMGASQALKELLTLTRLPDDTNGLHAFFLHQIKAMVQKESVEITDPNSGDTSYIPAWPGVYQRILGVLTVAFEPLSTTQIRDLGGIRANPEYVTQAVGWLIQFLDVIDGSYCWYHATVSEFLTRKDTQDRAETVDLYVDRVRWHRSIATFYLKIWGGLERQLPELARPEVRWVHGTYPQRHLSTHLRLAGAYTDLFSLVESRNWFEMQMSADSSGSAYRADLGQAWAAAERGDAEAVGLGQIAPLLGRELRYAVTMNNLNARTADVPTTLRVALLTNGLWNADQALTVARPRDLVELAPYLPEKALPRALAVARGIINPEDRAKAIAGLLPRLDWLAKGELLQEALASARAAPESIDLQAVSPRAEALMALIPHLPDPQKSDVLQEAFDSARQSAPRVLEVLRTGDALIALLPNLQEPQREDALREILEIARHFKNEAWWPQTLERIEQHLSGRVLEDTIEAIETLIKDEGERAKALAILAARVAELGDADRALAMAYSLSRPDDQILALAWVARKLCAPRKRDVAREALVRAEELNVRDRMPMVIALLTQLLAEAGQPEEALATAEAAEDVTVVALLWMLPHLGDPLKSIVLDKALSAARRFEDVRSRAYALADLVPYTTEPLRTELLMEILSAARKIRNSPSMKREGAEMLNHALRWMGNWSEQAKLIDKLVPYLPPSLLSNALEVVSQARPDADLEDLYKVWALLALAPFLPGPERRLLLCKSTDIARAIEDEAQGASALQDVANSLAVAGHLERAVEIGKTITPVNDRAKTLTGLSALLSDPLKADVLCEALQAALTVTHGAERVELLAAIIPSLSDPQKSEVLQTALDTARAIEKPIDRVLALASVMPNLDGTAKDNALADAIVALNQIHHPHRLDQAVGALAPLLDDSWFRSRIDRTVYPPGDERLDYVSWVRQWAPHLSEALKSEFMPEAFALARSIPNGALRVLSMAELVAYLPEPLKEGAWSEVFEAARMIAEPERSWHIQAQLITCAPRSALEQVITEMANIKDMGEQADMLAALAVRFAQLGCPRDALDTALRIGMDETRARALMNILPYLSGSHFVEAFGLYAQQPEAFIDTTIKMGAKMLQSLAPSDLHVVWQRMLHGVASVAPYYFCAQVGEFSSMISVLGGQAAVEEAAQAIEAMGHSPM